MNTNKQTLMQVQYVLDIIAKRFSPNQEEVMTDINFLVKPDSGELSITTDSDENVYTCVIDEWIDNQSDDFFDNVAELLRTALSEKREQWEELSIMKPYSFHLIEGVEDGSETELYLVDESTILIGGEELMKGLEQDLDAFFDRLLKE